MKLINKQQREICETLYERWTKELKQAYNASENSNERQNLMQKALETEKELIVANHKLAKYENFEM